MIENESGTALTLSDILQDVLAVQHVRSVDGFLDLGGDSLAAMLCIVRIEEVFGVTISPEDFFFQDSTVGSLASMIDKARAAQCHQE